MTILYIDIETIPGGKRAMEYLEKNLSPPRGVLIFEDIRKWEEKKPKKLKEVYEQTSLS